MSPYTVEVTLKGADWAVSKSVNTSLSANLKLPVTIDLADLALSNLYVSKDSFTAGEDVEASVIVTNLGGTDPGEFSVVFYDGSRVIKKKKVDGVDPGASKEIAVKWRTDKVSPGKHKVRAVVDPGNQVPETNETNNEQSIEVEVKESIILTYAIPILLIIGIAGLGGFKLYNYVLLKRLEKKQRLKRKKYKKEEKTREEEE
jgi:subtilase family serine protease